MWGATLPTGIIRESMPYDTIMLESYTDTDYCFTRWDCTKRVRQMQRKDMEEKELDIKYQ